MADQTPGNFNSFIRSKGLALTRADVESFAADEERKASRNLIVAGVALLPIIGAVVANSYLQANTQSSASGLQIFLFILIYFGAIISMTVATAFFLMTILTAQEAGAARRAVERYDERDAAVSQANLLAAAAPGIALFLRSFSAEDAGRSAAEIDQYYESEAQKIYGAQQGSGGIAQVPFDPLPVRNVWLLQMTALATVQQQMPTVLLENFSLSSEKQMELAQGQAITIPVLGEWWPVFVEFAGKARLIVIFLESATTSLSREIDFVVESGKRCVVICSEELRGVNLSLRQHAQVVTYSDSESVEELGKKVVSALGI